MTRKPPLCSRPRLAAQTTPPADDATDPAPLLDRERPGGAAAKIVRRPLASARRPPTEPAGPGTGTDPDVTRPVHQDRLGHGRESGVDRAPDAYKSGSGKPAVGPEPTAKGGDVATLDERITTLLKAGDMEAFVERAFDPMSDVLFELDELFGAMAADARVSAEHRHALAAQLDYINVAHFQEWQEELLESDDGDEE